MHKTWLNPNESIDIVRGPKEAQIPKHGPGTFLHTNHYKKNNTMKTKDMKRHECTLILGKGFEISTKIGKKTLKRELKVHLTSSPHLQFFKIIHCNLNGTKAATEGLMLFLFSGFLQGTAITRKI